MTLDRDSHALRALYFAYLGANGLMATYWAWHLSHVGLTGAQIGLLFGTRAIISTISQPVLASQAERLGIPVRMLRWGLVLATAGLALLPTLSTFATIALVFWLVSPALAVVIPLVDATVVLRYGSGGYGRIRMWGSAGYGLVVAGFGWFVASWSYADAGALAVKATAVAMGFAALAAFALRRDPHRSRTTTERVPIRWSLPLASFFASNALHWSAVMIFNLYLGKLVEHRGWTADTPGYGVAVAIVAEVLALAVAGTMLARRDASRWFLPVAVASALRWIATASAASAAVVIAVQLVHVLSFGLWIAASMDMLGRFVGPDRRPTLQGWFSSAVLGVGGLVGSALGGAMLDWTDASGVFYAAAALEGAAALGFLVARRHWPTAPVSS